MSGSNKFYEFFAEVPVSGEELRAAINITQEGYAVKGTKFGKDLGKKLKGLTKCNLRSEKGKCLTYTLLLLFGSYRSVQTKWRNLPHHSK